MILVARFFQALRAVFGLLAWSSATPGRRPWLERTFPKPQDSKAQLLRQYQGQMIPVVNAASFCGIAGQHGGHIFVHDKYTIQRDVPRVESHRGLTAPDSRALVAHVEHWLAEKP